MVYPRKYSFNHIRKGGVPYRRGVDSTTVVEQYQIFTAYTYANATAQVISQDAGPDTLCVSATAPPITLSPQFSVLSPSYVSRADFQSSAEQSFIKYLGVDDCSPPPASLGALLDTDIRYGGIKAFTTIYPSGGEPTGPNPPNATATTTSEAGSRHGALNSKDKIAIGATIAPIFAMILVMAIYYFWQKYRKRNAQQSAMNQSDLTSENEQPYLQKKPELEAKDRRVHELAVGENMHEILGNSIHEVSARPSGQEAMNSGMQELKGDEVSKELEGS